MKMLAPATATPLPPTPTITVLPDAPKAAPKKGGLSFGAIAKKTTATKTAYPVFPDQGGLLPDGSPFEAGAAAQLAAAIIEMADIEDRLSSAKKQLAEMVQRHYMGFCSGKIEIPSSVAVNSSAGEVLVTFANAYLKADEAGLGSRGGWRR